LKADGQFIIACEQDKIDYHMSEYKTNGQMSQLLQKIGFTSVQIFGNFKWVAFICQK
jgi:hypothetical protein